MGEFDVVRRSNISNRFDSRKDEQETFTYFEMISITVEPASSLTRLANLII